MAPPPKPGYGPGYAARRRDGREPSGTVDRIGDEKSFVSRKPGWTPVEDGLPARAPDDFTMTDLLKTVGEINPTGG